MDSPRTRFAAQLERADPDIDLIEAALLIAEEHDPRVDPDACRKALAELARRAATR